jgi:hypothetical protein
MFGSIACIKRNISNEYIPLYCYYDLLPFLRRYQQHNVLIFVQIVPPSGICCRVMVLPSPPDFFRR